MAGTCCARAFGGVALDTKLEIFSASKWLSAHAALAAVDAGMLSLDTRVDEVLNWWTPQEESHAPLRVRHLLAQTDGMVRSNSSSNCRGMATLEACAKSLHATAYVDIEYAAGGVACKAPCEPGVAFFYGEASWTVLGAVLVAVTGETDFEAVFQRLVARPLTIDCSFADAPLGVGYGARCSTAGYARFLTAVMADELVPAELREEAEQAHTPGDTILTNDAGLANPLWSYGYGTWRECASEACGEAEPIRVSSLGIRGFYPYTSRGGGQGDHWGVVGYEHPTSNGPASAVVAFIAADTIENAAANAVSPELAAPAAPPPQVDSTSTCADVADLSLLPDVFAPLIALGGCAMVSVATSVGLSCSSELSANLLVQNLAPGVYGTLCDFCAGSCDVQGGAGTCACAPQNSVSVSVSAAKAEPTNKAKTYKKKEANKTKKKKKKEKKKTGKVAKKLKEVAKKCAKAKSKKACKKHAGCRHSKKKGCILA